MKEIPGFENYCATVDGEIYSKIQNKFMKLNFDDTRGYFSVMLADRSKGDRNAYTRMRVHRLMAMTFLDNPELKPVVNHIDGDRTNNKISNLEWCTYEENRHHSIYVIKSAVMSADERALVELHAAGAIVNLYKYNGLRIAQIAKAFNISHSTVFNIVNANKNTV